MSAFLAGLVVGALAGGTGGVVLGYGLGWWVHVSTRFFPIDETGEDSQ